MTGSIRGDASVCVDDQAAACGYLKPCADEAEFTANVSHELKTPLTAISGYAELIASWYDIGRGHDTFCQ